MGLGGMPRKKKDAFDFDNPDSLEDIEKEVAAKEAEEPQGMSKKNKKKDKKKGKGGKGDDSDDEPSPSPQAAVAEEVGSPSGMVTKKGKGKGVKFNELPQEEEDESEEEEEEVPAPKKGGKGKPAAANFAALMGDDDDDDEEEEEEEDMSRGAIMRKSATLLLGGTVLVALFSDPMVDSVASFSTTTGIPAFFVSFLVTPFASNASELVSSLQFAKKKKIKNISLTYSQVYGAVTMNNTMCLGLFLLVVWYRDLTWTFSSEVVTTMLCIFALGAVTSTRLTFPTYMAIGSLLLYPVALALVYFLDYYVGWQ